MVTSIAQVYIATFGVMVLLLRFTPGIDQNGYPTGGVTFLGHHGWGQGGQDIGVDGTGWKRAETHLARGLQ